MRFLADENFDGRILRGLKREDATIDIVRVQDTEIYQADDPTVLEWAAQENRILLSHDISTIPDYAYARVRDKDKPMPGVILVHRDAGIGEVLEDLLVVIGASEADEYENQVVHLPLSMNVPRFRK
jgi:predicted nuclease of predicted toxin-antitoxin system